MINEGDNITNQLDILLRYSTSIQGAWREISVEVKDIISKKVITPMREQFTDLPKNLERS